MDCAECGALLLDFEIEQYNDICEDCYYIDGLEDEEDNE